MIGKKKRSKLQIAQAEAEDAVIKTNQRIEELGKHTSELYVQLTTLQELFDKIRNIPEDKKLEYEKLKKIRLHWKEQAEKIERDYKATAGKAAGGGVAGVGVGVAVVAMGPTVAMGVATTFGVASTGTAISTLSGAAATNAALAWLGGGALAAGGGGMAAGEAFLALAGPVGWAIAGVALLGSGIAIFKAKHDKDHLENLFCLISKRDTKKYQLANVELDERIKRIGQEGGLLKDAIQKIKTFGIDYRRMTEKQQYELGAYLNLMNASTQLLVNPIQGLQPAFTVEKIDKLIKEGRTWRIDTSILVGHKELIVLLTNLVTGIEMDESDSHLLGKSLKHNKKFLSEVGIKKKDFDAKKLMDTVVALQKL